MSKQTQRFFIKLAFDGTRYHGWQLQNNAPSVQAEINRALSIAFKEDINVVGCGRTDAGVHAKVFYAHFDIATPAEATLPKTISRINGILPCDIAAFNLLPVIPSAHARFDATARTYIYLVSQKKDPFLRNHSLTIFHLLDLDAMNRCAALLSTHTDFSSFAKGEQEGSTECTVIDARWSAEGHILTFTITANRFLRNMVRAITGTLIDAGKGKITPDDFNKIILSRSRSNAGYSVPAKGLILSAVNYPENIFLHAKDL